MMTGEFPFFALCSATLSRTFQRSNLRFLFLAFLVGAFLALVNIHGAVFQEGAFEKVLKNPTTYAEDLEMIGAARVTNTSVISFDSSLSHSYQFQNRRHQRRPIPLNELLNDDLTGLDCGEGKTIMKDRQLPYEQLFGGNRKIPRIVHQTGRSRCVTNTMAEIAHHWASIGTDWAYYFHSDAALDRLLALDWPEFPHISIVSACLEGKGTLKADLWRYLVLWEYGGVYADLDTKPNLFNATSIRNEDDGFFIVEQYHLLSQYFMAMSPRHPLMFYAIQNVLTSLLLVEDTGNIRAPFVTGPHALHRGFQAFRHDAGVKVPDILPGEKPAKAGVWIGTANRSITVCGIGENENEYVEREYIRRRKKTQQYEAMGMKHFTQDVAQSNKSCLQRLWNDQQARLESSAQVP